MFNGELDYIGRELQQRTQLVDSIEADFEKGTWTFRGPGLVVGAGEYLVISKAEWTKFWDELRANNDEPTTNEELVLNYPA